ncbi:nucleic-acid-binding protein from transposon X-element [Trichonephila clavipes]|nr:nucleic-acid-binding protein from transposon X-element [Trichonephila clavipes]
MPDHHPDEPFYRRAVSELQEVEETINLAVSDLASFPPCVSPGCPHHDSGLKIITPKNSPDVTPTKRVLNLNSNRISNKRKEESDFEYPPLRKTTKKQILNIPNDSISISPNRFSLPSDSNIEEITGSQNAIPVVTPKPPSATGPTPSGNQNPVSTLPPPVMLRITETVRSQMKIINEKFPKIRSRTTGEFIKLYTDNLEQFHELLTFAKKTKFQFYEIKPKNERPIKVVLKGLPRNFKVEEIQADLEELGFTPEKVNQLIGRRSKQPIPVFLVTLPRSIENLKIFHLKTLSYLSIRVEGYNGKGVTQCYTCNHFHHNSENCHLNPRCLKCGEGHITRECPITERLETAYCINCEMYGHMANWRGCPCFPKPPKGTALNNRNSYTNVYNSIIRPNVSYAQAANPNKTSTNFNSQNKQPMAPKGPVNSAQIEANRNPSANNRSIPNFNNKSNNNFNGYNFNGNIFNNNNFNLQATLQMTMQCLCQLSQFTQAIATSNPNFMNNFNQVQRANNNPNQMYALLEASCNNNNDLEYFLQTSSHCVVFGDFNATHSAWNCNVNSNRGKHLFNFANILNLHIAFPDSPTRFGHNSANTIDFALIKNFYYPYTIKSINDLYSDHNPVFLNFDFKLKVESSNPRAITTNWKDFRINLNNNFSLFNYYPNNINNTNDLETKITEFTEAVVATHSHASQPIVNAHRNYTPNHITQLIKHKNNLRKRYQQTLNPFYKTLCNRAQANLKKELKIYSNDTWNARLEALNTTDNSLWEAQRFLKNKRSQIPTLNCATGMAVTDPQKANLLANTIKNNFIENNRMQDNYDQDDEVVTSAVNTFLSSPFYSN